MKPNKIISCVIALTMIISMFSCVTVSAASLDGLALTYTFTNEEKDIADGTVTISGVTAELQSAITGINIYWGESETTALTGYANIKTYTTIGAAAEYDGSGEEIVKVTANYNHSRLSDAYADEKFTCTFTDNMRIPYGATHLIVEVITADSSVTLTSAIPEEKITESKENMLYSMIWASDIHIDKASFLSGSNAKKAISDAVTLSEIDGDKFKGMILNGDIANSAKLYQYEYAEELFETYGVDFPVYYASGNHDIQMYSNGNNTYEECAKAMDIRFDKLKDDFGLTFDIDDPWCYETTIEGQHYIFFATPYYSTYGLTDKHAKWLEEKLCYYEKSGVPTFVFSHVPYTNTFNGTATKNHFTMERFLPIMKAHPTTVFITSHIHMELDTDAQTIIHATDEHPTYIDTASMYDVYFPKEGTTSRTNRSGTESRYVEIYPDKIVIKSRNHSSLKWIPRGERVIAINGVDNPFEGDFSISSTSDEGVMTAGTVLTAKLDGADITDGYTVTWYDMLGTELGTGSTYTVETADASVSAKIVKTDDNSYAYAVSRYIAPVEEDDTGDTDSGTGTDTPSVDLTGTTTVVYNDEVVNISGNAGTDYAGENATIVLVPGATYDDISTAKYVGECTIAADGTYNFKFKAGNVSANDVFLVKVGSNTVSANSVVARANEELVEVTPALDEETNILSLSIKNLLADTTNAKLIIATYDANDKLIMATPIDYSLAFNENFDLQSYTGDTALEGTYAKIYMWTNLSDLVALSNSDRVEIPTLSSETAEETIE